MKFRKQRLREAIAEVHVHEEDQIPPFFPFAEEDPIPAHFPFALEINPNGEFDAEAARLFGEELYWEEYWERNEEPSSKKKSKGRKAIAEKRHG